MVSEQFQLVAANSNGQEMFEIQAANLDIEVGRDWNTFEMSFSRMDDPGLKIGDIVSVLYTEYGGFIKRISTDTESGVVTYGGYTWRGILKNHVIEPPPGQNYYSVTGTFPDIIWTLFSNAGITPLFNAVRRSGQSFEPITYQFDRYVSILDGIEKMLRQYGKRMSIEYNGTAIAYHDNVPSRINLGVLVYVDDIVDYSDVTEISEDNDIYYRVSRVTDGVNHLICRGQGELAQQEIIHLYVGENGQISQTKYFTGLDEVTAVYDNFGAEHDDLLEGGTERLLELQSKDDFSMDVSELISETEYQIGDIIGGLDYITGIRMKAPITGKIFRRIDGVSSVEYSIEEDT